MHLGKLILSLIFVILFFVNAKATILFPDTIPNKPKDTATFKPHNPKLALKRSAMLPGWGQVYNKQTWKVPIIYAALGITGYVFFDNCLNSFTYCADTLFLPTWQHYKILI
jgi:hypothetical protein